MFEQCLECSNNVCIFSLRFQKWKIITGKTPFFVIGPFCTLHSIHLNIGF